MKSITICGNLGANAVRRTTSDGKELMTFSVATNDANCVTWFNVVSNMRKSFEYLVKGQCVCVVGDLQVSDYKGRVDLSVYADRIELCGKSASESQSSPGEQAQGDAPQDGKVAAVY